MPAAQAALPFLPALDPAPRPRRLPVGYYLDNFETLLAEVERQYEDLLIPAELAFLAEFRALPRDARRLYARLLSRRGPWFRRDRLGYGEIDCATAAEQLLAAGFAAPAVADDAAALVESLRHDPDAAARLVARAPLLRLLRLDCVAIFRLLFFGNLTQDLSEFVLADLGVLRFEPVPLDPSRRHFANRAVVEQHLHLHRLLDSVLAADRAARGTVPEEVAAAALAIAREPSAWDSSTHALRDGLLVWAGRARERQGALEEALDIYRGAERPPARERAVRVLRRLGRPDEARALLGVVAAAPHDESERIFAERGPSGRRARRPGLPTQDLAVSLSRHPNVEAAALEAFAAAGYRGFFAENWLWRTLCGLALWDLVFAPIPGAFTHRFQHGPRDLHDGFRTAREPAVSERIAALAADPGPGPRLLALWDEKYGTANRLVAFGPGVRPSLEIALGALDGRRIAAVVDRLSRDLRRYGAGMPDLFLVDPGGEVLLAEIKGPGDALRPEQEGWIEFLNGAGLPAVVVHARADTRAMLRPHVRNPA